MSDLKSLMKNAQQIVELINKLKKAQPPSNSPDDEKSSQTAETESFNKIVSEMGVVGSINKNMMNNDEHVYFRALAQQISDFISPILTSSGGILQLTDVYCIYNRARGTDLISPQDLFQACQHKTKQN